MVSTLYIIHVCRLLSANTIIKDIMSNYSILKTFNIAKTSGINISHLTVCPSGKAKA